MERNRLLNSAAALAFVVMFLHITAIVFHLYWNVWLFDKLVHFFGGWFISVAVLWLYYYSGYFGVRAAPSPAAFFFWSVGSALAVGIGWEFFESSIGATWSVDSYWADTIGDVSSDLAGGLLGFLFVRRRTHRHHGA